jgi:hypothetical protein
MLHSGCPKCCWDDCLVNVVYVRSHAALAIFSLEGQVAESRVKGEPYDISPMAEYAWYEGVKLHNTYVNFPDSKIQVGRDMGAAMYIGPVMARKGMKKMGK